MRGTTQPAATGGRSRKPQLDRGHRRRIGGPPGLAAVFAGPGFSSFLDRDAAVLAFGAAALLYLVTEELLAEAHETRDTPILTASFFLGFILIYALAA